MPPSGWRNTAWGLLFEQVDVTGKTDWDLGVARKSVNRKGKITVTPSKGYWFLSLRDKLALLAEVNGSFNVPDHFQETINFFYVLLAVYLFFVFSETSMPFTPYTPQMCK